MNNERIEGFLTKAEESGLSKSAAFKLLSKLADADPGMFNDPTAGAGPDQGAGAGAPPTDAGSGLPPDGSMGVPPEIEQAIQSLPPEVLQQLLQEIQAEMANGGSGAPPQDGGGDPSAGAGGPPPGAGGPPPGAGAPPMDPSAMGKTGSALAFAKTAEYANAFYQRGCEYNLDQNTIGQMYKQALEIIGYTQQSTTQPKLSEKQAAHLEGFLGRAQGFGWSQQDAVDVYNRYFNN